MELADCKPKVRFKSFSKTRVESLLRIPSNKSLLYQLNKMRLTLRTVNPTLECIDEEGGCDGDRVDHIVVQRSCVMGWLTEEVFVYNIPVELTDADVNIIVDVFLKLGFTKLRPANIQPQI
jgi:hypothetical protein